MPIVVERFKGRTPFERWWLETYHARLQAHTIPREDLPDGEDRAFSWDRRAAHLLWLAEGRPDPQQEDPYDGY